MLGNILRNLARGADAPIVVGTRGDDVIAIDFATDTVFAAWGDDVVDLAAPARRVLLGAGDDVLAAAGPVDLVRAGPGDDTVRLEAGGGRVALGQGDDVLHLSQMVDLANGGGGADRLVFDFDAARVDVFAHGARTVLVDRFTGERMFARNFETIEFADRTYTSDELQALFARDATPAIQVGRSTQTVTVNDPTPTVSVVWDRAVQQAVIETGPGPTVASRAYAMVHTAMYDAWAAFDDTAMRVAIDLEGDNRAASGTPEVVEAAMSHAALTVLRSLFPDQRTLFEQIMSDRYGLATADDGSLAAEIGIDAAEDLLASRRADGANQAGGYADTSGYIPYNAGPLSVRDIARWTPESVPVDPEGAPDQVFLTPHWGAVTGFALPTDADGANDLAGLRPDAPVPFFLPAFAGSTLDVEAGTVTLAKGGVVGGVACPPGTVLSVDRSLIGEVIDPAFVAQAEAVVDFSAGLTDEQKIIAEFWEDGGGTAFPPGTFMTFGQFVSARDGHDTAADAQMFLALSNAVMDAGIATWEAKVHYDYVRPVRAIRDLGELGLIGTPGVDAVTGETGHVVRAWGGIDPDTGLGRGTVTILAENFTTFQLPGGNVSPPFAEYVSGHSAFSAAGAEVLTRFTGSDAFGGSVTFAPDSIIFEDLVPAETLTLDWATFGAAADEAGLSRRYGGIHFEDGDLNGRLLGRDVGAAAFELARAFAEGRADPTDRPFHDDVPFV